MFYLLGPDDCLAIVSSVAWPYLGRDRGAADDLGALKMAYGRYLSWHQPRIPLHESDAIRFVDDPQLENRLIDAYYEPSPLDDLPRYRDQTFFENGPALRSEIAADVAHVEALHGRFHRVDPDFWRIFDLLLNYILCPRSRYSRGGTDSGALGVMYLSQPRSYSTRDLYEIMVHEFTHTIMFIDELSHPHYADESLLPLRENWARAAITCMNRPLDKTLHSMVVSTEIMLHRKNVLGDEADTTIHPATDVLVPNVRETIESILSLPNRTDLVAPRGFDLLERCRSALGTL